MPLPASPVFARRRPGGTTAVADRLPPLVGLIVRGRSLPRTLLRAVAWALLALVVFRHLLIPVRVYGPSMEPAFPSGSVNLVSTLRYRRGRAPARGEVVAVAMAGRRVMLLKRVIGLPGETVAIAGGVVYLDGRPLDEPYVRYNAGWDRPPVRLEADEYFLIGDNRGMPAEAHTFGRARRGRLVGSPVFRPPAR